MTRPFALLIAATLIVGGFDGAAIAAGSTALPITSANDDVDEALDRVNEVRRQAGLGRVTLDRSLSAACEKHAIYLLLNNGSPFTAGLKAHQEEPSLPGATPEGAMAGRASDISSSPLSWSVARWVDTLYHRSPIMDPGLKTVGMAAAKTSRVTFSLLMFGERQRADASAYPVLYPAERQDDVPHVYNRFEIPDPVPGGAEHAGYPITLHFDPSARVTGVSATLTDPDGADVPLHLSSPERPATGFPQGNVVCLIPKQHLRLASRYWVNVTASVNGVSEKHQWWFETVRPTQVDVANPAAVKAVVNRVAYFNGVVVTSGLIGRDAFLRMQPAKGMAVSAWLTPALWAKLSASGYGARDALRGKRVRLLGTAFEIVPGDVTVYTDTRSELTVLR